MTESAGKENHMKKIRFIVIMVCCLMLSNVLPAIASEEGALPKVIDNADLLTETEEAELSAKITEMVTQYQTDVVLVTEYQKQASDIQEEADLLLENPGYGIGDSKSGILFVLEMNDREWAISTQGDAITKFSDYDLEDMGEIATQYFADGQYYMGFDTYLNKVDGCLASGRSFETQSSDEKGTEGQQEVSGEPEESAKPTDYILPALISGLVISIVYMVHMKSGMKTANMQKNANAYQREDARTQIRTRELFLTSTVHRRPIEREEKGSGSGGITPSRTHSTTHRSSSGTRHGGAKGKF